MKPDSYIKLDGRFFHAVVGLSNAAAFGYLWAIWYYRHHNHCKGLENDSEFLRKICHCEKDEWDKVFNTIFSGDEFFMLDENGLWQQKRAQEDYNEDTEKLMRYVNRGTKGAQARWGKKK